MIEKELIKEVNRMLRRHNLIGRAFEDGCTDCYDVEYVLLSKEIVDFVIKESEKKSLVNQKVPCPYCKKEIFIHNLG